MDDKPDDIVNVPANTPATERPAPTPGATRATILLVEDDRSARRYMEIILQRAGYEVVVAADGLEAIKVALTSAINAVITDAIMPHLNGHELCRFLRRNAKLSSLPIIMLSGIEKADSSREESTRADVYLAKPVRPEELTDCLARLLSKAT